ncbi:MAG: serine/threonine protein kinase, partial [Polyangiaceae bacterium]|nr:serine/threonine protein kinase [Polyangiaceae bacterium]
YEVIRCIGLGGMGAVYEARHVRLSKRVALKTMLEGLSEKPDLVERILREGETIARIHHPHVVDIYDVGIHDGVPYLVEEFLEGETLYDLLDRVGSLSATQIADLLVPIADALAAAHDANVVHRDLKPANIFLARDARGNVRPKLLDFGISKMSDRSDGPSLTKAGSVIGTPEYMPPEQIHLLPDIDGRADQYALGVVMYECITGVLPYRQASLFELLSASVAGLFDPPHAICPDVDVDLELLVLRAMATDRRQRFGDMHELVRQLLPLASEKVRSQFDASGALLPQADGTHPGIALPERPSSKVLRGSAHAKTLPATPVDSAQQAPAVIDGVSGIRLQPSLQASSGAPRKSARSKIRLWMAMLLIGVGMVGAVGYFMFGRESEPSVPAAPSTFEVALRADPVDATLRLDGREIGRGEARVELPRDGREHLLEVRATGY